VSHPKNTRTASKTYTEVIDRKLKTEGMQRHVQLFSLAIICLLMMAFSPQMAQGQTQDSLVIEAPGDILDTADMPGCRTIVNLPPATVRVDSCMMPITWRVVLLPMDTLLQTNGGLASFQFGMNEVEYVATNSCGNIARDTMVVTIEEDTIPPVAVGVSLRTISLDGSGMAFIPAQVFEGGSIENCFKYYKIRRLVPDTLCTLPGDTANFYNDEVKFCCTDLGDTVKLEFRVYDTIVPAGFVPDTLLEHRSGTDTVCVVILDKAPPQLICPPDMTIECGEHIDFDTLGMAMFMDNCDTLTFQTFIESDLDQCGTGEFRRIIVGTDLGGNTDTCVQIITVTNGDPFDGTDSTQLQWPDRYVTLDTCLKVPDTSLSGRPIVLEDQCSLVSVSWSDDVYQFSRDACSKVIRTWRVIDWCVYDPKVNSACVDTNGCWTFEQIIKVIDSKPPIITHPNDTMVSYLQPGCDSMIVILDSATADECFMGEEIVLRSEVDYFVDGTVDREVIGGDPSGFFPVGDSRVLYYATDECGNTTVDTLNVTVKDRVLPTPIAMNGLSTTLIDMGGGMIMVSVNAKQLDAGSYDNCSSADSLKFTFSPNLNDTVRVFTCDSLGVGTHPIEMWVTDECGNQDFARTSVFIDDFDNVCPDSLTTTTLVQGLVSRHDGMRLKDVDIQLTTQSGQIMTKTNDDGQFEISDLEKGQSYRLKPDFHIDPMLGITTKDVIAIQRHLLGMTEFDEVYKYVAADVDQSGHISARDITTLRKLILGKITQLPRDMEWVFMPSNFQFKDPNNPLDEVWPTTFSLANLTDPAFVGFNGYRLGDLDMSYGLQANQTRKSTGVRLEHKVDGSIYVLLDEEMWVEGLQMEIRLTDTEDREWIINSDLEPWSEAAYNWISEDILRVSWSNPGGAIWTPEGGILLELIPSEEGEARLSLMKEGFDNLIFESGQELKLQSVNSGSSEENLTIEAVPNPFVDESQLLMFSPAQTNSTITVRNALGSEVYRSQLFLEAGWNEESLDGDLFQGPGLYIVEVKTGMDRAKVKLIKAH
jgi:hypothetical protein